MRIWNKQHNLSRQFWKMGFSPKNNADRNRNTLIGKLTQLLYMVKHSLSLFPQFWNSLTRIACAAPDVLSFFYLKTVSEAKALHKSHRGDRIEYLLVR